MVWLFREVLFAHRSEHTKTAKHEQEQANDVSPFIGTILMMQRPIHGTWPPIATLRPMQVALNYRDRTSYQAAPFGFGLLSPNQSPPNPVQKTEMANSSPRVPLEQDSGESL